MVVKRKYIRRTGYTKPKGPSKKRRRRCPPLSMRMFGFVFRRKGKRTKGPPRKKRAKPYY